MRWQPSPQFTIVLLPSGEINRTAGDESRLWVERIRTEQVIF
jgi:hypothetical protein